jgi:uncharacterized protein YacL (UPF0231 family)
MLLEITFHNILMENLVHEECSKWMNITVSENIQKILAVRSETHITRTMDNSLTDGSMISVHTDTYITHIQQQDTTATTI